MFIHSCVTVILEQTCNFHYCIQNHKYANITTSAAAAAAAAMIVMFSNVKFMVLLVTYNNQLFS
jgi:hypothetical protein